MSEFLEGQIVKTKRDNEFKIIVVDGASSTSATKKMTVAEDADTYVGGTNNFGVPVMGHSADGKLRIINLDAAGNVMTVAGNPSGSAIQSVATRSANVANGTPVNIDTVIGSGKTVSGLAAQVAATGLFEWALGTYDGAAFVLLAGSVTAPAAPNAKLSSQQMPVGDGTLAIRLIITNLDINATDALSTIEWLEQ